jgi:hypothetical protein
MERFTRCGVTVAAFCDRERVSVSAFYHWRKKLQEPVKAFPRSLSVSPALVSKGFVPVQLLQPAAIEVWLSNGVRLSLPTADLEVLRQTLQIVSRFPASEDSGLEGASC